MFCVYRIHDLETEECYIGSSNNLKQRLQDHKKLDCSSKKIIDRKNYEVEILEDNIEADERRKREQYYIEQYGLVINKNRAYQSKEDRKQVKKEISINHYWKTKYDNIECICGSTIRKREKARHERSNKHKKVLK